MLRLMCLYGFSSAAFGPFWDGILAAGLSLLNTAPQPSPLLEF
jgi:hypothetical protein